MLQAKQPKMFDVISNYITICLNEDQDQFEHSNCLQTQPFCERYYFNHS